VEVQCLCNSHDRQEGKKVRSDMCYRAISSGNSSIVSSALSLRLFGEDITTAARDGKKVAQTSQLPQNAGDVAMDEGTEKENEDANLEDEGDDDAEQ
jgi:hypothetical protein